MKTTVGSVRETVAERLTPALESLDENVRAARRAIAHGRQTAEDLVDQTTLQVRKHPMASVAVAAGAGALAGCLVGFALGWKTRRTAPGR
jgi:ElaB/YqjD/DUF883 family membrane-anchored ribosome-binding protein